MRTLKLMWKLWIKPLFCKHDYYLTRCLYGDQAMMLGRYEYWCPKCGKIKWTWKLLDNLKNKEDKK